jgi:predicted transcriptional regulator
MFDHYIIVVTLRLYQYGINFMTKQISQLESVREQLISVSKTLKDNEWFDYIASHLLPVQCEIERQLQNLKDPKC